MTETALHRQSVLEAVARAQAEGVSQNKASRTLGVASANISRWRQRFLRGGLAALEPQHDKCGRKPLVVMTEDEQTAVRRLKVQMESTTAALRTFAGTAACSQAVSDAILKPRRSKHTITGTLRAQAAVPQQVINFYKSPKNVRVNAFICPRSLTYTDALGTNQALQPGDLFERDDMSNNFIVWVPWPWGGDPCSDKYGVRIARGQCLEMIDVRSLFFPSFNFLIRLRDSYRADDIWQWLQQTYTHVGMPRIGERWERGTWASRKLRGDQEGMIEAGHTGDDARLGGLAGLGVRIITSQSPTTKIIENRFNYLQRIESTIKGQIGRRRGEFEATTKRWMACRAGDCDPREHFLSYEQASNQIEAAHQEHNWEKVEGLNYTGVPAVLWQEGLEAAPLAKLPPEKGYLFAREKREVTVRKGHALVRYTHDDGTRGGLWFHHEDLWRHEDQKVAVYYDNYAPGEGATVVVLTGRQAGTVLPGVALIDGCAQFSLAGEGTGDLSGLARKKAFMDAVISETRTMGLGGRTSRSSTADNGAGGRTQLSHGGLARPGQLPASDLASPISTSGLPATAAPRRVELPSEDEEAAQLNRLDALEAELRASGHLSPV